MWFLTFNLTEPFIYKQFFWIRFYTALEHIRAEHDSLLLFAGKLV